MDHLAFDLRLVAGLQIANRSDAGFIDVTQRQVQQQILRAGDAQLLAAEPALAC